MATTKIPDTLVMKAWAKDTWASGLHKSYFEKFTGTGGQTALYRLRRNCRRARATR